jgi:D-alanyl-lipoteichoic acid acyltransferase DltB (MBOAT superfamily)
VPSAAPERRGESDGTFGVPLIRNAPREVAALSLALLLFALIDAALFATPLYRSVLDPASTAGSFERGLALAGRSADDPRRDVLVLGDSRIYNGFDAALASHTAPAFRFINASVPGTTPRCWAVFDRALDPEADRFRAVVVPVDTLADDDGALGSVDGDDRLFDLRYVVFSATPLEIARISASFPELDRRIEAAFDLALRGPLLREDLQAFALDPRARFAALAAARGREGPPRVRQESMAGLRLGPGGALIAPAGFPDAERGELERQVLHVPVPSPSYARYRREWLGALVRRYRATGTPVIFVRIPTRPLQPSAPAELAGSLAAFVRQDGAVVLPQEPYLALERPPLFADAVHLNERGAARFSRQLARDVARTLDPPGATASGVVPAGSVVGNGDVGPTVQPRAASPLHRLLVELGIGAPLRFQSFEYAVFFAIVVAVYFLLRGTHVRRAFLLIVSWYVYARWNAWYLAVLIALTATDFAFALGIERCAGARRRALLTIGVAVNLLFLGTAKYADFLTGTLAALLRVPNDPWALHVLVPVGISFHTFQSISYLVDVSRGKVRAERNPLDYALYLAFFPQLLAGPIVRAGQFFGELALRHRFDPARLTRGLGEIGLGLLKKSVIADRFAPVADAYFAAPAAHPGAVAAWGAAFAFAMQIYFDFSGYTDIALGSARVLGFDFPPNFRRPYLAWSITEFWRRWHMTLSSWLRDYLYIPLGGNRGGALLTYRNLILTMLLGGLWHGANWTFVAWGGYHGVLLAIERARGVAREPAVRPRGLARIGATALTFVLVVVGWVLFRAQSFPDAFGVLRAMFAGGSGAALLTPALLGLALAAFAIEIAWERGLPERAPPALRGAAYVALLLALELASDPGPPAQFVYFKF